MNRYAVENLFGIEGFHIAWYGVIIRIGMLLGIALALYRCRHTGICKNYIYDFALWLIPVSIICAKAYCVIFEWDSYKNDLTEIFAIRNGGLAIYGGMIGGALTGVVFCHIKKISFGKFADTLIPGLVLGQAVGRWGNFVNQESFGNVVTNPRLQFFPYYLIPGIRVSQVLSAVLSAAGIMDAI